MKRLVSLLVIFPTAAALVLRAIPARAIATTSTCAMCDAAPPAEEGAATAAASRSPSLITELVNNRWASTSDDIWSEMTQAFAAAAGVPYEQAKPLNPPADWEMAEIDFAAFAVLLASKGDDLPEEKSKAMFDKVDTDNNGKIPYVQYFQAVNDEANERRRGGSGGGFSFGSLFGR
jgi:hypothetical protein